MNDLLSEMGRILEVSIRQGTFKLDKQHSHNYLLSQTTVPNFKLNFLALVK